MNSAAYEKKAKKKDDLKRQNENIQLHLFDIRYARLLDVFFFLLFIFHSLFLYLSHKMN